MYEGSFLRVFLNGQMCVYCFYMHLLTYLVYLWCVLIRFCYYYFFVLLLLLLLLLISICGFHERKVAKFFEISSENYYR